ncbi:hypothetical protein, partial [Klebsiella pneumoniae]|uniref:hypothetical protein n=1 Tax=Klebsiella pneumoniae TaxID=573 RepID=UPI0025A1E6DC
MNLWSSRLVLVAGWFLCSSALLPEECQPLVTPLSLADPSMMYGRTNFIMGYTDHPAFNNILKVTDSSWLTISQSPANPKEAIMDEMNKINGKCFSLAINLTIDGDTATAKFYLPLIINTTSVFNVLPSCDGCLVLSGNTT